MPPAAALALHGFSKPLRKVLNTPVRTLHLHSSNQAKSKLHSGNTKHFKGFFKDGWREVSSQRWWEDALGKMLGKIRWGSAMKELRRPGQDKMWMLFPFCVSFVIVSSV